jgi:hypothetical protein
MPATFKSGRPRIRDRVEDAQRINAAQWCRANKRPTVEKTTPDGNVYELGICPTCTQTRRDLFETASGVSCRRCAKLIYTTESERNSQIERIKRNPSAAAEAMETMKNALETGNAPALDESAHVLQIAATVPAAPPANVEFAQAQAHVVTTDLVTATALLEIVTAHLTSGEESHTDRRGHSSQIPLRPDAIAKLVNAFCALSNLRANRAGIATQIVAREQSRPESFRDTMIAAMKEAGFKSKDGHTMDELEALKNARQDKRDG